MAVVLHLAGEQEEAGSRTGLRQGGGLCDVWPGGITNSVLIYRTPSLPRKTAWRSSPIL